MSRHVLRLRRLTHRGLLLSLLSLAACAGSQSPPPGAPAPEAAAAPPAPPAPSSPPLPLDPKVTAGALPNGLSYLLQRQKPEDKRAYLILAVKAGSVFEEDDQRGL